MGSGCILAEHPLSTGPLQTALTPWSQAIIPSSLEMARLPSVRVVHDSAPGLPRSCIKIHNIAHITPLHIYHFTHTRLKIWMAHVLGSSYPRYCCRRKALRLGSHKFVLKSARTSQLPIHVSTIVLSLYVNMVL